jgi:hypothetical protein
MRKCLYCGVAYTKDDDGNQIPIKLHAVHDGTLRACSDCVNKYSLKIMDTDEEDLEFKNIIDIW